MKITTRVAFTMNAVGCVCACRLKCNLLAWIVRGQPDSAWNVHRKGHSFTEAQKLSFEVSPNETSPSYDTEIRSTGLSQRKTASHNSVTFVFFCTFAAIVS